MSGPVQPLDVSVDQGPLARVEVKEGRSASVGGMSISRVLPTKGRRTIGPWCFVDLILPPDFDDPHPMEVGPHPHTGLATVTWLFEGEALHTDSLGTEQPIRPGQLNLMTSGNGIAHAELGTTSGIHGAQMWLAQPEETRHGQSRFEHVEDLPRVELRGGEATVMIGELEGSSSPASVDWPTIGLDVQVSGGQVEVEADPAFEYAVVPIDHAVKVEEAIVEPGWLALVPTGADLLPVETSGASARFLILGGEPLGEPIEMWWNFVARSKEEITAAWKAWQNHDLDRFGSVRSQLARIDAPAPPWLPAE
ncbi:MAG TPA: pirin family protein [Acidimicrobiia bacterium]|jgi:redox-sensitive bicupin YhaK (pirin superfamily)